MSALCDLCKAQIIDGNFVVKEKCEHKLCSTCINVSALSDHSQKAYETRRTVRRDQERQTFSHECPCCMKCSICMEDIETQTELDSCRHVFCFRCIRRWSETNTQCPICQQWFHKLIPITGEPIQLEGKRDTRYIDFADEDENRRVATRLERELNDNVTSDDDDGEYSDNSEDLPIVVDGNGWVHDSYDEDDSFIAHSDEDVNADEDNDEDDVDSDDDEDDDDEDDDDEDEDEDDDSSSSSNNNVNCSINGRKKISTNVTSVDQRKKLRSLPTTRHVVAIRITHQPPPSRKSKRLQSKRQKK